MRDVVEMKVNFVKNMYKHSQICITVFTSGSGAKGVSALADGFSKGA